MQRKEDMERQSVLEKHLELVIEANKITNITRIASKEEGRLLHIEDSLIALSEVQNAPQGTYADLGSGAGYPGIPIAVETGRKTILIESVGKKACILKSFIKELSLADTVSVYSGRIEEYARNYPKSCAVVSARALSSLPSLMELASPLLIMGGHLVCYKAHIKNEEISHARGLEKKLGMKLISTRECYLSDDETYRTIIVFKKVAKPKLVLPRKLGQAQKHPLHSGNERRGDKNP